MSNDTPDPKPKTDNPADTANEAERKALSFKLKPSLDKSSDDSKDAEKPEMKQAEPVESADSGDAPKSLPKLPPRAPAFGGQDASATGSDVQKPEESASTPSQATAAEADVSEKPSEPEKPQSLKPTIKKPVIRPAVGKSSSGKPVVNRPVITKPVAKPSSGGIKKKVAKTAPESASASTPVQSESQAEQGSPSILVVGVDAIAAGVAITFFVLAFLEMTSL